MPAQAWPKQNSGGARVLVTSIFSAHVMAVLKLIVPRVPCTMSFLPWPYSEIQVWAHLFKFYIPRPLGTSCSCMTNKV